MSSTDLRQLRIQLVADAGAALLVLLSATALSIYKPWGKITTDMPSGLRYVLLGIIAAALMFIVIHHLTGGGLGRH